MIPYSTPDMELTTSHHVSCSYPIRARDDAGFVIGVFVPENGHQSVVIQNHGNRIPNSAGHQVVANDNLVIIVPAIPVIYVPPDYIEAPAAPTVSFSPVNPGPPPAT